MTTESIIGLIGAGEIGAALAVNALRAGHQVIVHDRRGDIVGALTARGAIAVDTAREVGARASLIQVAVMNDEQVGEAIAGSAGILDTARPDTLVLVHSTVHPRTVRRLAAEAAARGVVIVDAPVTDPFGVHGIEDGTASFVVGGPREAVERARPLLERSARKIFHLGPVGAGATAKLIRNLTMYVTLVAAHEARRLGGAAGIDRTSLREILAASGASSPAMDHFLSRQSYDEAYRSRLPVLIEIFEKDIRLALELAAELGVAVPGGDLALEQVRRMLVPAAADPP